MSIVKYNDIQTAAASNWQGFYNWLVANKPSNSFLQQCTILSGSAAVGPSVTILKNSSSIEFTMKRSNSEAGGAVITNGTTTYNFRSTSSGDWNMVYCSGAILCDRGLIINLSIDWQWTYTGTNNTIGAIYITLDSEDELAFIWRDATINSSTVSISTNLKAMVHDTSSTSQTINLSPTYNCQKTALIPIVVTTSLGQTTIPYFYVAMQTELPSLGLQAGRIDSTDYITSGYCFIRDE